MKAICHGLDLSDAIGKVSKAAGQRTTNPVLECIKIKAEGNTLIFSATDLELGIEKKIKADVLIEGEVLVMAKYFSEFVKTLVNEEVEITINQNNQLKINFGESTAEFACADVNEFPELNIIDTAESVTIVKKDFKDLINKVVFSVATDDSRPVLRGVLLEIEDRKMTAVALDGYRMALCSKVLEKNTALTSVIISARCLSEIAKLIDEKEEFLRIYIQKNYLMADLIHTKIIARLMSGDFINYKQIIPSEFETVITINKKGMEIMLDRANLVARAEQNKLVKLNITNKKMEISSSSEVGSSVDKIDIALDGKDLTIAFNSKYLIDALKAITDEFIKIKFRTDSNPCIISPIDAGEEYLYLILPIRMK